MSDALATIFETHLLMSDEKDMPQQRRSTRDRKRPSALESGQGCARHTPLQICYAAPTLQPDVDGLQATRVGSRVIETTTAYHVVVELVYEALGRARHARERRGDQNARNGLTCMRTTRGHQTRRSRMHSAPQSYRDQLTWRSKYHTSTSR